VDPVLYNRYIYLPIEVKHTIMELGTLVLSLGSMVFSLSSASPFTFFNKEHIVDQVSPVVDQLWREVSNGKAFITTGDLSSFFIRYDDLEQPFLFLLETPFVRGEESWTRDFQSMQMTPELSKAYFRSLDVFRNVWLQILTNEDMFTIIEICEKHADIQGSGHISEKQFKNGMKEVVLRSIPFSLLFTRFMVPIREDFTMYDRLHWPHFLEIFNDIDSNGLYNSISQSSSMNINLLSDIDGNHQSCVLYSLSFL